MKPRVVRFVLSFSAAVAALHAQTPATVVESAREIPVVASVDVVVAGGTVAGVAAAEEIARSGRSVYLIAPRPYLGEDLADTLHLWLESDEKATGALMEKVFAAGNPAAPVRLKRVLEEALLNAKARFLLASYVTDVLVDGKGHTAGVVMANRAGRQAVLAKVVVDATPDTAVARMAGVPFQTWKPGPLEVRRVVLDGKPAAEDKIVRSIPTADGKYIYREYRLTLQPRDLGFAAMAEMDHQARDITYREAQDRAGSRLWFTPPDPIVGQRRAAAWRGFEQIEIGHFRPRGAERLLVAGARADVPRTAAEMLLRPTVAELVGRAVGAAAARQAASLSMPTGIRLAGAQPSVKGGGEIKEELTGLRPTDQGLPTVPAETRAIPLLGTYDVVVIGGGTSGAAAAIGACRQGVRTLVVEYQEGLGGTGTLGLIGKPYHGREAGFSKEVPFPNEQSSIDDKMEWYRKQIRSNGCDVWFRALGAGAWAESGNVKGAVVITPLGRGVVAAKVVIDATGNADVAIAAGAEHMYGGGPEDIAMQGAGLPKRAPGDYYNNTDYLLVDEADLTDVWTALVGVRQRLDDAAFDSGSLIQTRERRRVVGDHVLTYLDQVAGRKYPDSIVYSGSDYDSHGYPSDDFFALLPHDEQSRKANHPAPGGTCYTPYRCLLPKGLDGILVTGLAISMHRDASAMVRMQRDLANQGYAAGVAAAMAIRAGVPPRRIDVRELQRHLVKIGSLPPEALEHQDSFPRPEDEIRFAVRRLPARAAREEIARRIALILTHQQTALPMLQEAWKGSSGEARLTYAKVLGMLGEKEAVPDLAVALDEVTAWDARILQGYMAEYSYLPTPIDSLILALGRTADEKALPPLLKKLATLDESVTLSHFRSLAIALEEIGSPVAAKPLADLLGKPGMRGHVMTKLEPLYDKDMDRRRRIGPLREITLARALYRCGDYQGLGERILREYENDVRGLFARHARSVLGSKKMAATR